MQEVFDNGVVYYTSYSTIILQQLVKASDNLKTTFAAVLEDDTIPTMSGREIRYYSGIHPALFDDGTYFFLIFSFTLLIKLCSKTICRAVWIWFVQ